MNVQKHRKGHEAKRVKIIEKQEIMILREIKTDYTKRT